MASRIDLPARLRALREYLEFSSSKDVGVLLEEAASEVSDGNEAIWLLVQFVATQEGEFAAAGSVLERSRILIGRKHRG